MIHGRHVAGNLYNCNSEKLANITYLINLVKNAAKIGNMTLLDIKSWKIGNGVSVVGIVLESHISIHTWPEHSFATVDVYSCGAHTDPEKAFDYIASSLEAQKIEKKVLDRSYEI